MTKRQQEKAIRDFKSEILADGWKADRYGNLLRGPAERIHFTPETWRLEKKVDKKWVKVTSNLLSNLEKLVVPKPPATKRKVRRVKRKRRIAKKPIRDSEGLPPVLADLSPDSQGKIAAMGFKQVQTNSRVHALESTITKLTETVTEMATMVHVQLRRITANPTSTEPPLFSQRMFNKISIKLRKKSIDAQVEDLHQGVKRRRIFRCSDWSKVEHLITYKTITDGIEELEPREPRKTPPNLKVLAKKAPRRATKGAAKNVISEAQKLADTRHQMERDNVKNTTVPVTVNRYFDDESEAEQKRLNQSRLKAERVIVKICSAGGPAEGAMNNALIEALHENGFDKRVAFYAASNCGRVSDPHVIKKYEKRRKAKAAAVETNNPY